MTPTLFLFDDRRGRAFAPFSLTRPAGELLFGAFLLRERSERFWETDCNGYLTDESLADFHEEGAPPVVGSGEVGVEGYRVLQSSLLAPWGSCPPLPTEAATLRLEGIVVGWILPPGTPAPGSQELLDPQPLPGSQFVDLDGRFLKAPWELMDQNGDQLGQDIPTFFPGYAADEIPGCHVLGPGLLSLGKNVEVEPGSVFDVRTGPIRLSDGTVVRAHTRLKGPAFVGPGSTLLGGTFSEVSIGPVCKVRGEVESSLLLGYSNKAHDGFLGHAYLGRWVNLGAFTTNSDLRNNYGSVRAGSPTGPVDTGLIKVGCFLGDHVKTGIGTLLTTGCVVGAGSNVFGGEMPPTYVPPFSWGRGNDLTEFHLERFLEVAAKAMERRGMALDGQMENLLRRAWKASQEERRARR
jgi:UDP-N-acetylglucosamine diphosphorylase/glucosamine-1-phosphate N-acetyltransferase